MLRVNMSRKEYKIECDGCHTIVEENTPSFTIDLGCLGYEDSYEERISLCEDCGNDLMNDLSDEYNRFCDLGL